MKLHLTDIEKSFDDKKILKGLNFTFEKGKIYGLLGRNGAGKTTLFNIIYKELNADKGEVSYEDEGNTRVPEIEDIGMIFAEPYLPEFLTGYEYIKFIIDISKPHEISYIDQYFDMMDFDEVDRHKLIKDYSSGMKSKTSLLALYVQQPPIILLDEPLTAVDVLAGAEIKKFFRSLKNDHIIILSTHMLDLAKDICDEIVLLNDGLLTSLNDLEKDENYEERIVNALREQNVWCYILKC